jgi:hypothetical protein
MFQKACNGQIAAQRDNVARSHRLWAPITRKSKEVVADEIDTLRPSGGHCAGFAALSGFPAVASP